MKKITSTKLFSLSSQFFFVIALACLSISSCKKDEPVPDAGYNYFPNNIGHYCIYEVDSTIYDDFNNDTIYKRCQIKELVQSYFTDNSGRQAMRIERYWKPYIDTVPYASLPWTLSRVWAFTRTNSVAEKMEENERFVRLTFVPRQGKKWNGNEFNTIGEWDYKYESVDEPYTINSMTFDSTCLVKQKVDTNMLTYKTYFERYAKNVGLIEKNVIDVQDDSLFPTSVLNRIDSGLKYNVKLVSWGN